MNAFRRALLVLATASALAACGSDDCTVPCDAGPLDGGPADAGPSPIDAGPSSVDGGTTPDAGAPEDGGAPGDAGPRVDAAPPPFQAIEPCMEPGDYRDGTYVSASDAYEYEPPCVRVRLGGSVFIEASTGHPLAARTGGSPDNPIPSTTGDASVTFDTPGFYPYVCTLHAAKGMIGVVQVVP